MKIIYLTNALLTFWLLTFALIMYWMLYPYKILEVKTQPYHVVKPVYKPGETFEFVADFCKYSNYKSNIIYQFLSAGVIYGQVKTQSDLEKGCYTRTSHTIKVPDIPDGSYVVRITNTYYPNPFREVVIPAMTEQFEIRNDPPSSPSSTPSSSPVVIPQSSSAVRSQTVRPTLQPSPMPTGQLQIQSTPQPVNVNVTQSNVNPNGNSTPQPTPEPSEEPDNPSNDRRPLIPDLIHSIRDLL